MAGLFGNCCNLADQAELAQKAGMHLQSIGKIKAGKTTRLNSKSSAGLSKALQVLEEYLDAVCKGVPVAAVQQLKIRPQCWIPRTKAENMWLNPHSKFCFACGTKCVIALVAVMSQLHLSNFAFVFIFEILISLLSKAFGAK